MLTIYIGDRLPNVQHLEILFPFFGIPLGVPDRVWKPFRNLREPLFRLTPKPEVADFFLIPHNYQSVKDNIPYLRTFTAEAKRYNKTSILFFPGDSDASVSVPHSIVFRHSQYRYKLQSNEIIMPAYAEDLLDDRPFSLRSKSNVPRVGFCGWAKFQTSRQQLSYGLKLVCANWRQYVRRDVHAAVHKQGLWYRRKAMRLLQMSPNIKTDFILRNSYGRNEKTISLDPIRARREYIENIERNDFTLCVKGDGNYSYRFYETLSLGRIPLLVDTGCVFPLEDELPYKDFIVRIPYNGIGDIAESIFNYHAEVSAETFVAKQKQAREHFEKYLRIDRYLEHFFSTKIQHYL